MTQLATWIAWILAGIWTSMIAAFIIITVLEACWWLIHQLTRRSGE